MGGHEALAVVPHEGEQVGALLGGEVDLANAEEEDGVEVVEVAGQERLALGDPGAGIDFGPSLGDEL
jgi:hypothetical protein